MNIELNARQSNTRRGSIQLPGNADLTGKENLLLKVVNNNGVPNFALPGAVTDICPYICMSGDIQGNLTSAEAPDLNENCRILLDLTCNAGDKLALSPNIMGRVYAPQASAGSILVEFIAEEAGDAGQDVLCRRIAPRLVTF
jgi:hypothetical protein